VPAGGQYDASVPASAARYTLLALLFCCLWASAFVALKIALRFSPPLIVMSSRFLIAGAGMLVYARLRGAAWPSTAREWAPIALIGVLNNALYLGTTAVTLQYISAGMGAVLASTNPLVLALVAPWLLGERLTALRAVGLVTSFAGVATVMWSRIGDQNRPIAMAVFLAATSFMTAGTIAFKRLKPGHDLRIITGGQVLAGGIALVAPSLLFESVGSVHVTTALVLAQAYLVIGTSGAAMLLWTWLLSHGDATRASAWFFLNPVLGLVLGALFLGEPLQFQDFVGSGAVALGIYVVQRA
jgi:drug/metabolite transporter (DMT)-like permease